MKRIVFWMVALLLMSGVAMAQGNRQGGRQQMDPKNPCGTYDRAYGERILFE